MNEHDRLAVRAWWLQRCQPENPFWLDREAAFMTMRSAGLKVVPFSRLPALPASCTADDRVVVYLDPYAHAARGKALLSAGDAARLHPGHLCSLFLPPGGVSYRLLRVGLRSFGLRYSSPEWQSNAGAEGDIEVTALQEGLDPTLPAGWPPVIWAVDFVQSKGELYAVDLNPAPGVQGSGLLTRLRGFSIPGELLHYAELTGQRFWETHEETRRRDGPQRQRPGPALE